MLVWRFECKTVSAVGFYQHHVDVSLRHQSIELLAGKTLYFSSLRQPCGKTGQQRLLPDDWRQPPRIATDNNRTRRPARTNNSASHNNVLVLPPAPTVEISNGLADAPKSQNKASSCGIFSINQVHFHYLKRAMKPIDCIITAAGLSSRMGQWKMMLPWQEGTILDASIKNALQFCSRIILVTGFHAQELQTRYSNNPRITLAHNADYQHGLFSSVICGARAVTSEYCFITHGDLPCITADVFRTMWPLRYNGSLLPHYQGIPGHPILVASRYLQQRLNRSDGSSVRKALLSGRHQRLELEYPEIIFDIDTPADFIRLQNSPRFSSRCHRTS